MQQSSQQVLPRIQQVPPQIQRTPQSVVVQLVPKGIISTPKVIHFQSPPEPIRAKQSSQIRVQQVTVTPPPPQPQPSSQLVQHKRVVPQSRFIVLPSNETYEIATIEQVSTSTRSMPAMDEQQIIEEQVLDETVPQGTIEQVETSLDTSDMSMVNVGEHGVVLELSEESTRRITENGLIRYFCPQCNVRYTKYKYLKTHIKDCGSEFQCTECNAKFKQRRTYVAHAKQKHNTQFVDDIKQDMKFEIKTENQ